MQKEKILNGTQFGFQKHKSSTDAVLHLIEALQENYDKLKISVAVDRAKAFNSISHENFLKKIEAHGFSESAVDCQNNVSELEKCVSEILEKTDNYLKQNKLNMNTGKTEIFRVSKENENFNPIVYRGQEIKPQSHCRYLGIMIDSKLNFHVQLNKVLSNMATAIRSIYLIRYRLLLKARLMVFKSLVLSHLTFNALFFQNLKFCEMQRINRQINWGIKVCYMRKKFERSTDLLVKSNILPAELLISQMSVSKLRNDISILKSDGTESFSLSGNVLVRKNNRTEQLILLRSSS